MEVKTKCSKPVLGERVEHADDGFGWDEVHFLHSNLEGVMFLAVYQAYQLRELPAPGKLLTTEGKVCKGGCPGQGKAREREAV